MGPSASCLRTEPLQTCSEPAEDVGNPLGLSLPQPPTVEEAAPVLGALITQVKSLTEGRKPGTEQILNLDMTWHLTGNAECGKHVDSISLSVSCDF